MLSFVGYFSLDDLGSCVTDISLPIGLCMAYIVYEDAFQWITLATCQWVNSEWTDVPRKMFFLKRFVKFTIIVSAIPLALGYFLYQQNEQKLCNFDIEF